MADLQHHNDHSIVLNPADQTIVVYPVTPKSGEAMAQRFAESFWVFTPGYALPEMAKD
jgi:hypothetical protein